MQQLTLCSPFLKCHFDSHPWCSMVPIPCTCVFPRQDTQVPQRHKATVFMGLVRTSKQRNGKDCSEPHSAVFPPPASGATAEVNIHPRRDQREPEHIACIFNVIINGRGGWGYHKHWLLKPLCKIRNDDIKYISYQNPILSGQIWLWRNILMFPHNPVLASVS